MSLVQENKAISRLYAFSMPSACLCILPATAPLSQNNKHSDVAGRVVFFFFISLVPLQTLSITTPILPLLLIPLNMPGRIKLRR